MKVAKTETGFTIVELIVALFVGVSLVGSINLVYTNQSYLSQQARDVAMSNAYIEGKIESLRSKGYLGINTGTTDITTELPTELNEPRSAQMSVTQESSGLKKVVLTISFNQQGINSTKTYTTYIGELGAGQQ